MTTDDAFNEAVKGVHAILHTASPINFSLPKYEDFLIPAVNGTVSILKAAKSHAGPQLEAVTITSSMSAIFPTQSTDPTYSYTHKDWNTYAENKIKELGSEASKPFWYAASKTAAERAVWKFTEDEKPPFAVVVVNPSVVMGPPLVFPANPDQLNETLKPIWQILSGKEIPPKIGTGSYVDVRDVAAVHLFAVENPKISNHKRYITIAGKAPPQAIADNLHKLYPERSNIMPKGNPGEGYEPGTYGWPKGGISVIPELVNEDIKIQWIPFEKSIAEVSKMMVDQYLK
jgi:nucleoside-diphosphate-sugar epimerase